MDKRKLKEFTKKVDAILWKEWDPIAGGVPKDEYTSYALGIAGKAWNGESKQAILEYLFWAENENMGLNCTRKQAEAKNAPLVDRIVSLVRDYKA